MADAWKANSVPKRGLVFVGARGGIEERLVPRAGYPLEFWKSDASIVSVSGERLRTLFQLPLSFFKSAKSFFARNPKLCWESEVTLPVLWS